nr:MAG: RNA-dependent RNA-polymerase [Picobirnavirus sp.]
MLTKLTDFEHLVVSNNEQLRRYLESLLKEQPHTQRSWLYENTKPEEVLESWMQILADLENGSDYEKEVFRFDTAQLSKWGPQGGHPPIRDVMTVVKQGFGNFSPPKGFKYVHWFAAKGDFQSQFSWGASLRPASYKAVVDDMRARDVLESNSGWPDFARRNLPKVKQHAVRDAESGRWQTFPAIALFRNYNQKLRLVWMFPMAANLVEGSFTQPLQRHVLQRDPEFFSPWIGFEAVRALVTKAYASGKYLAASDFASTDAHFRWATTKQVFDVVRLVFQSRYERPLYASLKRMHTIPLIIGPNEQLTGNHGVSSGSNWTNLIETLFDWIFSHYVAMSNDNYRGLCAIGDDMCWVSDHYDESFSVDLERLGKDVGQEIKADKTTNNRDSVKFLQRLFQRGYLLPDGRCRAVYSTVRALKSSIYPERFHNPRLWSSDMFCARQFMILENCCDHPLFEEFVRFVCKGQRDLVPFAKKTNAELARIHRESKLLPGLNPTYNQEKRDRSFGDFQSIQLARSL